MRFRMVQAILAWAASLGLAWAGTAWAAPTVNRYGGPVYSQAPALVVTASLVAAGGGAAHFSLAKALTSMIGPDLASKEVAKLQAQYGKEEVGQWLEAFDFAVKDGLRIATSKGIALPAPALSGKKLAETLVQAGIAGDQTFWIGLVFDKALSHDIHNQVMDDIDANPTYGNAVDYRLHQISDQAFYDLAHALGYTSVRLSSVH